MPKKQIPFNARDIPFTQRLPFSPLSLDNFKIKNRMKKLALLLLTIILFNACQMGLDESELRLQSSAGSELGASKKKLKENEWKVRFNKNKKGQFRMVIKDPNFEPGGFISLQMSISDNKDPQENISLTFGEIDWNYRTKVILPNEVKEVKDKIITLSIGYFNKSGEFLKSRKERLYVSQNGKTQRQSPRTEYFTIKATIDVTYQNGGGQMVVMVEDDPAGEVAAFDLTISSEKGKVFNQVFKVDDPKRVESSISANGNTNFALFFLEPEVNIFTEVQAPFKLELKTLNINGDPVGDGYTGELELRQFSDYRGRIRRIRIRERASGTDYNLVVVTQDADPSAVASIRVQFNEPFDGPVPKETTLEVSFKNFNADKAKTRFVEKGLSFSESPVGYSYEIKATMLDYKGKALGEPFIQIVTVEPQKNQDLKSTN